MTPKTGLGIAAGALTFYFADRWVDHMGGADRKETGLSLVLGFSIAVAVSLLQLA